MIIPWLWAILLGYWIIMALKTKDNVAREAPWTRVPHLAALVGSFWLLLGSGWVQTVAPVRIIPDGLLPKLAGDVLTTAGVGFAIWARATLGANWSGAVTLKQRHEIVRDGPYRWVRHPIYAGILFGVLGTAVDLGLLRGFIALAILTAAFLIKLSREEALLSAHFPEEYSGYRAATKRLIPYVW